MGLRKLQAFGVKVDMLEELVRGDGCCDIRGVGVCGAGCFRRDEEDLAQVSIGNFASLGMSVSK